MMPLIVSKLDSVIPLRNESCRCGLNNLLTKFNSCWENLDGRNRAIAIAESLARVIAAIRIASESWRSYLPPKHRH